jgi:hypothetical protein
MDQVHIVECMHIEDVLRNMRVIRTRDFLSLTLHMLDIEVEEKILIQKSCQE